MPDVNRAAQTDGKPSVSESTSAPMEDILPEHRPNAKKRKLQTPTNSTKSARARLADLPSVHAIASHGPLRRSAHYTHRLLWRQVVNKHARPILQADSSGDDEQFTRDVIRFLQLPSIALTVPNNPHHHLGQLKRRFRSILAGEQIEPEGIPDPPSTPADDARFRAAKRLISKLVPSRAIKALLRQPLADIRDPTVQATLRSLHPPRKPGNDPEPLFDPDDAPEPICITPQDIERMIKSFPRNSAPGPSGWTFEMIRDACANDELNKALFARLFTRIANGDIPAALTPYLLVAELIPACKAQGKGVRPIAIGEAFYRAVCSHVVALVAPAVSKQLLPLQLGVAVKAGAEVAVHRVQALLEQGLSTLKVDCTNAFNSIHRRAIFESARNFKGLKPALRLIQWAYGGASPLLCMHNFSVALEISSEEGARQGCPLGSLLFCVGLHPRLQNVQDKHANSTITAFIDDISVSSRVANLPAAATDLKSELATVGLTVNPPKCQALITEQAQDEKQQEDNAALVWLREQGIPTTSSAMKYLGAPIGTDAARRSALLHDSLDKQLPLFSALADARLTIQEVLYLARHCIVHKMSHAISTVPPSISNITAREFDLRLRASINCKLGFELEGTALEQAILPLLLGGLGIRSARDLAPIAFLSSHARAAPHLKNVDFNNTATITNLAQCIDLIQRVIPQHILQQLLPCKPSTLHFHFQQHSAHLLQHAITSAMEREAFNRLLNRASIYDLARLKAVTAPKAALWITAAPTSPDTRLDDCTMRLAVRRLLGLPPSDITPFHCPHCHLASGDLQVNPWHPTSCPRLAGTSATRRHNQVLDILARWMTRLGGFVVKPTKHNGLRHNGKDIVPDLDVQLGPSRYIIDVTIRDPTAPSHVTKGAQQSLAVAAEAEKEKRDYYRQHLQQLKPKATFVPFVVEAHGGLGIEASKFIDNLISQAAALSTVWQPSEFVNSVYWSIACAVQRSNASIMRNALRHAAAAAA